MAAPEERIAVLETMVNEHALTHVEFRDALLRMEQRIDARFDRIDDRFARADDRFTRLDDTISKLFTWTVGIQITVLLAVVGSLLGLVAILAPR
jgi:hypothetical protein